MSFLRPWQTERSSEDSPARKQQATVGHGGMGNRKVWAFEVLANVIKDATDDE